MSEQLVTPQQYRAYTKDVSTQGNDAVTAAIEEATKEWEEWADRWFVSDEYTETVVVDKRGRIFPKAVPVTSAPSGYTIRNGGQEVIGGTPVFPAGYFPTYEDEMEFEFTYTGGYTPSTVPRTIAQNIMETAYKILHPNKDIRGGETSVRVGDIAVSYEEGQTPFENIDKAQKKKMAGYRRRHV